MTNNSLFENLGKDDKVLMENFSTWLSSNKGSSDLVCEFLAGKIGDKDLVNDFKDLSEEIKLQACLEYLAIGLTAGSVKKKEVESFLKK